MAQNHSNMRAHFGFSLPWSAAQWDEECGPAVVQCVPPPQWFYESSGLTSGARPPYGQAQLESRWPWPAVQWPWLPSYGPSAGCERPVDMKTWTTWNPLVQKGNVIPVIHLWLVQSTKQHLSCMNILHLGLLTWRTIFLWMANFAMMWARSRWPLYLHAGSTQALGSRHGQAKVIRRRSLLLRDLLLSWMWWGACSTNSVENWSRQIRSESSRSACFSGSNTWRGIEEIRRLTTESLGRSWSSNAVGTEVNCIWGIVRELYFYFFVHGKCLKCSA